MSSIALFIYDFTQMGGAERACANLSNELVKSNKVVLISLCNKAETFVYELDQRVKTYRIIEGGKPFSAILFKAVVQLRKIIRTNKISNIICMDSITPMVAVIAKRFTGAKLIACERTYYNRPIYSEVFVYKVGAWVRAHKSDMIQVLTDENRSGIADKYHVPVEKVVTIPNWINENAIKNNIYNHEAKRIISVGRASPEKNYEGLITVAKNVKRYAAEWEWHIWGNFNSDYGHKILNKIKEEHLDDFLICKGTTNNIYDIYQDYSLFVMTSIFEGMPNAMLEAKGSKLPLVAFDCKTGPSELIVDGKNGFLIPLGDNDLMSEKIIAIIRNQEMAERLSSNWSIGIEKYLKKNVMNKWNEILEER